MSETNTVIHETYDNMIDGDIQNRIDSVHDYWQGKKLSDLVMPEAQTIPIDDIRDVKLVEILPDDKEVDPDRTIVLALPYLNGYTPHHFIRAKTLQILTAPNHRLLLLPNSVDNKPAYQFTFDQERRLGERNFMPLGEVYSKALEVVDSTTEYGLGSLAISGFSQGGLTALAIAAVNSSSHLHVELVNADETPSQSERTAKQLSSDFMQSSGLRHLWKSIHESRIPALSQAMNIPRLSSDLVKFGFKSRSPEAKLLQEAMSGSADYLVERATNKNVFVKLGFVAASSVFDPSSITTRAENLEIIEYGGSHFKRKHATGDNVILHALMADQGLRR